MTRSKSLWLWFVLSWIAFGASASEPIQNVPIQSPDLLQFVEKRSAAQDIARQLFLNNTTECPFWVPEFQAKTHRLSSYPKNLRKVAAEEMGAGDEYSVYDIQEPSINRLQLGDVLLNGQGWAVTEVDQASLQHRKIGFVSIRRGQFEGLVPQTGQDICPYRIRLSLESRIQAKAKGGEIILSTGLLDFVQNEHELALVIAHEMAHLTHSHSNSGPFSITLNSALEFETDQIGLDYLIRAGFDPVRAIEFWQRWADEPNIPIFGLSRQRQKRYQALKSYLASLKEDENIFSLAK